MRPIPPTRAAGASVVLLLLWLALWLGIAAPPTRLPALAAVLLAWLPLAPAVPLVLAGSRGATGWCSLTGVFYAGFSVMEMVANPTARWWATAAFALSVAMIGMLTRLIRRGRPQGR